MQRFLKVGDLISLMLFGYRNARHFATSSSVSWPLNTAHRILWRSRWFSFRYFNFLTRRRSSMFSTQSLNYKFSSHNGCVACMWSEKKWERKKWNLMIAINCVWCLKRRGRKLGWGNFALRIILINLWASREKFHFMLSSQN